MCSFVGSMLTSSSACARKFWVVIVFFAGTGGVGGVFLGCSRDLVLG